MIDLSSLVSSFVLGIIGWFIYEVYIWPYYVSPLRNLPGPQSKNPIYDGLFAEEEELLPSTWIKKYGNVMKYNGFLNRPTVIIADPKIIHEIAVNQARDFVKPNRGNTLAVIGNGIILAEGDDHKRQRKMMNPAFAYINIKEMVPVFTRVALKLKGLLEDKVNAGESNVNLTSIISKTTLDIIGLVGFNYEFNSLTSSNELAEAYIYLTNSVPTKSQIILNSISDNIPYARKLPIEQYKKFNRACEVIDRVSSQLVKEKYREDKDNKLNGKDLLSLLINTNKTLPVEEKMTDEELKYQIMTFLIAGHETTSTSTSWALYFLSQHPHEQDLLREELVKAFPDKSKFNPTLDDINSLEYLNCVIKETLRLYSPVTNISRVNTKDKFFGEHFIPKNTLILLSIFSLHRSPSIWGPTADDFDPKRWLNAKDISSLNYLPFFAGSRTCIGNKLALAEFKLLLCMLIRNFVFKPVEGFHIRRKSFPLAKPVPYLNLTISKVEA